MASMWYRAPTWDDSIYNTCAYHEQIRYTRRCTLHRIWNVRIHCMVYGKLHTLWLTIVVYRMFHIIPSKMCISRVVWHFLHSMHHHAWYVVCDACFILCVWCRICYTVHLIPNVIYSMRSQALYFVSSLSYRYSIWLFMIRTTELVTHTAQLAAYTTSYKLQHYATHNIHDRTSNQSCNTQRIVHIMTCMTYNDQCVVYTSCVLQWMHHSMDTTTQHRQPMCNLSSTMYKPCARLYHLELAICNMFTQYVQ